MRAVNAEEMQALLKRDGKRPLLVNYWATWCDPCRDEFPDLVKIDQDYRAKGLDFIAITLDDLVGHQDRGAKVSAGDEREDACLFAERR